VPSSCSREPEPTLILETSIPLSDVGGRIHHMRSITAASVWFVMALGNNAVEVIEVGVASALIESMDRVSLRRRHSEKVDLVLVANAGEGSARMFRAADLTPVGRSDLHDDGDNVRIDRTSDGLPAG
jgi:hypothetical protein